MCNLKLTVEEINKLQPLEIIEHPVVRDKFIQIHDTLWGADTGNGAYERESRYFNQLLSDMGQDKIAKTSRFSIFCAFIDLAINGLTLKPGAQALCYLVGRNVNIGSKQEPKYEARVVLKVSGYGELVNRIRCGQIRYADNPVIVYENDEFSFAERNGQKSIDYVSHFPHTGQKIVAVYLKIIRNDGSIDYSVMYEDGWLRLQNFSLKHNQRKDRNGNTYGEANSLYTSNNGQIDPGFLVAKCIKHAFKSYPKARIGRYTELQSQEVDQPQLPDNLYNIDTETGEVLDAPKPQAPEPFGAEPMPQGVTVTPDEEECF